MNCEVLKKRFAEANLKLEILKKPIGNISNNEIFQIDIQRTLKGNTRTEYFRIFPGHTDNRIEVVNIDKNFCQLVLLVHEPAREFEVKIRKETVKQKTPDRKRHLLCGLDERQLFIAVLPRGVSTVANAHKSLKTTTVTFAEGRAPGRTIRQGEWFFVNISDSERSSIEQMIKKNILVIEKNVPIEIRRGGKPHMTTELIRRRASDLGHGHPIREFDIYVRGSVRHADHETVKFAQWRKVIRNAEQRNTSGINFVD